nr:MAG TPA_asm: Protein of unknown function (DUF2681) [Caudoviricetes sp.]
MIPIEEFQKLQWATAIFILIATVAIALVFHFAWKNKDQQETIVGLSKRIKDLNTRITSLKVRLRRRNETHTILDDALTVSANHILSLERQLRAATQLLEAKDHQLTGKTSMIIDMQNDFDMFDAGYESLQEKYHELLKNQEPPF